MATKQFFDTLSLLDGGMDAGKSPDLLNRNQAAFLLNATVRGGFARTRPPVKNRPINYASDEIQAAVTKGLFQGYGYYKPDSGNECIVAQISGRLFRFEVSGNEIDCTEISIPNDLNPASLPQAWLWQSEKWLIINNGSNLPIFYDGTTSRRSLGASVLLNTVVSGNHVPIGSQTTLTLNAVFGGDYNYPVLIAGEYYQPVANASGYNVDLKANAVATSAHAAEPNSAVTSNQGIAGVLTERVYRSQMGFMPAGNAVEVFKLSRPFALPVGTQLTMTGSATDDDGKTFYQQQVSWRVVAISGNNITVTNTLGVNWSGFANKPAGYRYEVGNPVNLTGTFSVSNLGYLGTALLPLAPGETATVALSQAYTGTDGAYVYIGTDEYIISQSTAPAPPTNVVVFINLSDGTSTGAFAGGEKIYSVPELPAGRMGAYGMLQNWMCLTDGISFVISDVSRGPSGTIAEDRRDAVLKTVDLTFMGGKFAVPNGSIITSMTFAAKLDESLGQGPIQIGTQIGMFSASAPVDFATIFASTNPNPILPETIKGVGPVAQDATIPVNSDTHYRAVDGISSLIQARREFNTWGNVPISEEVNERILDLDNQGLLIYANASNFLNRELFSVSPQASPGGVLHAGSVVISNKGLAGLGGKTPPVYDGLWTGPNVIKWVRDANGAAPLFNGTQRQFTFTYNISTAELELWELLKDGQEFFDNGNTPITWGLESRALFIDDKPADQRIRLLDGQISLDQVRGNVNVRVWFKSDEGCWTPWREFSVCAAIDGTPGYFPRLGLGEPSFNCADPLVTDAREGYSFEVKILFTGSCRLKRARFTASTADEPETAPVECNE